MKLKKVISGGQTGADRTALECAKNIGLATGGLAPKGYRTETGPDTDLILFDLKQDWNFDYKPRTISNVRNSEATLWFGTTTSPGHLCTQKAATRYKKTFIENPNEEALIKAINEFETINFAGNRLSKNPNVVNLVTVAFEVIERVKKAWLVTTAIVPTTGEKECQTKTTEQVDDSNTKLPNTTETPVTTSSEPQVPTASST